MSDADRSRSDEIDAQLRRLLEEATEVGHRAEEATLRAGGEVRHFQNKPNLTTDVFYDLRGALEGLTLADALLALQSDLAAAHAEAAEKGTPLRAESLTVELMVGITRSAEGKARLRIPYERELTAPGHVDPDTLQIVTVVFVAPVEKDDPLQARLGDDEL